MNELRGNDLNEDRRAPSIGSRCAYVTATLATIAFAVWFTLWTGHRGFFAFDQSIVFDGGYRVYLGQVPYRDFVIGVGPVVFWLQGLFFRIFGVSYTTYVLSAALQNGLAALLAILLIQRVFPSHKAVSWPSGLLTGVWFYAPFGTAFYDQTGALWILVSFTLTAHAMLSSLSTDDSPRRPRLKDGLLLVMSGIFLGLAFLTKQNIGALAIMLGVVSVVLMPRGRFVWRISCAALVIIGIVATMALFVVWVCIWADYATFVEHFFRIPSGQGMARFLDPRFFATAVFKHVFHYNINSTASLLCLIVAALSLLYDRRSRFGERLMNTHQVMACIFIISLALYQHLVFGLTLNDINICYPFIGVILMLGALVTFEMAATNDASHAPAGGSREIAKERLARAAVAAGSLALCFISFLYGIKISLSRDVPLSYPATFEHSVELERMKRLKWAEPSYIPATRVEVRAEDFEQMIRFVNSRGNKFFIFPDYTVAYGLTGAVPPQPVLWFHKGLTYPTRYSERVDRQIVDSLKKNNIDTIVLESASFFGTENRLNDFPMLKAYIHQNFRKTAQYGIFEIWTPPGKSSSHGDIDAGE